MTLLKIQTTPVPFLGVMADHVPGCIWQSCYLRHDDGRQWCAYASPTVKVVATWRAERRRWFRRSTPGHFELLIQRPGASPCDCVEQLPDYPSVLTRVGEIVAQDAAMPVRYAEPVYAPHTMPDGSIIQVITGFR